MQIIQTADLTPEAVSQLSSEVKHWLYNGFDCCVTREVFDVINPQLDEVTTRTYQHALSLQGPVLDMKLRGVLVDQRQRAKTLAGFEESRRRIEANLNRIVCEGVGYRTIPINPDKIKTAKGEFNWNSPAQMQELLYDVMRLPKQRNKNGITADRNALEKLGQYFLAQPIVNHILTLRELAKKIGVLKTSIDDDGRIRTSYNIAGTDTGRFSSNASDFGSGTNLQNITDELRRPLIADPGMKFAYIDLEQAESRAVGAICWNLFNRGAYLDACESGDLHTTVTKLARRTLAWTGDPKQDRQIADTPGYRHLTYRDLSKKLGHGSNYGGQPPTMARHSQLPVPVIKEFQGAYFSAFPEILMWHEWVKKSLMSPGYIVSLSGRKRWFFGRRDSSDTIRAAIAFDPQGSVGDILNAGMRQVWRAQLCQLLLQVHDAILIQYPEADEDHILPEVMRLIRVPITLRAGRILDIPCDCAVGWNFSKLDKTKNPDGLTKWPGPGSDSRRRQGDPRSSRLDFILG